MTNAYKKSYGLVKANLDILLNSEMSALVVLSPAGLGKTTLMFKAVKDLGLAQGEQYLYFNSYFTPLSFYQTLEKTTQLQAPRILILDDVETILADKNIVNLLKSATWENEPEKRIINYCSTSTKVKNKTINFNGKIIILINEMPKNNSLFKTITDRVLFTELSFTNQEILELMKTEIVPKPYKNISYNKRQKVFNFIRKNATPESKLSFRVLIKGYNNLAFAPNHWQELTKQLLSSKKEKTMKKTNSLL